jgi:hypothetical protein
MCVCDEDFEAADTLRVRSRRLPGTRLREAGPHARDATGSGPRLDQASSESVGRVNSQFCRVSPVSQPYFPSSNSEHF